MQAFSLKLPGHMLDILLQLSRITVGDPHLEYHIPHKLIYNSLWQVPQCGCF